MIFYVFEYLFVNVNVNVNVNKCELVKNGFECEFECEFYENFIYYYGELLLSTPKPIQPTALSVPRCAAPQPYPTPIPPIRTLDPIIKPTPAPAAIIICNISTSSPSPTPTPCSTTYSTPIPWPIREPTAVYDNNSLSVAGQVEEGTQKIKEIFMVYQ